jgi:hypothetical protein
MGVAVEDGKYSGQHHGYGDDAAGPGSQNCAEDYHRKGNARLDGGNFNAHEAYNAADEHHGSEGRRNGPESPPTKHGREETDGYHGQHVVKTPKGMRETAD